MGGGVKGQNSLSLNGARPHTTRKMQYHLEARIAAVGKLKRRKTPSKVRRAWGTPSRIGRLSNSDGFASGGITGGEEKTG